MRKSAVYLQTPLNDDIDVSQLLAEIGAVSAEVLTRTHSSSGLSAIENLDSIHRPNELLSPIHSLPSELFADIFAYSIPPLSMEQALKQNPHPVEKGEPYPHHARLVIRKVCRLWNAMVLNTPRLWSVLAIDSRQHLPDFKQGILRSKTYPLDIYISRAGWHASIVVDYLGPEIGRIRQLIVPFVHYDLSRLFPAENRKVATSLETLAWSLKANDFVSPFEWGITDVKAPNLQSIALVDSPLALSIIPTISLPTLRCIRLLTPRHDSLSPGHHLDLLMCCPCVEELEIHHMSGANNASEYEGDIVPLHRLTLLAIHHSHDDDTIIFLENIQTPILEELTLNLETHLKYDDQALWPIDQGLRPLLNQGLKSLRKMTLEHLCLSGDDDIPLLSSLVNLCTLEIRQCIIGNAILAELTPERSSSTWPCPNLSFILIHDVKLSGEELIRLIWSRTLPDNTQETPTRFTTMVVKNPYGLEDHHEDELLSLAFNRSRTLQIDQFITDILSSSDESSDVRSEW